MTSTGLDTSRPFSRAQAAAAGIKDSTLRGPRFRRLYAGVYVAADAQLDARLRARAALLPYAGRAFASHATAARVLGVPTPHLPEEHVSVVERPHRRTNPGVVAHVVRRARTWRVDGIDVSEPAQLFVELATQIGLVDLVVAGDHMAAKGWVTPSELLAYAERCRRPGAVAARRAARYVRSRVRSPMESRTRMLLVLAGLPEPEINALVQSGNGSVREHDLLYRAARVVIEYDGRQHAEDARQWRRDLERREDIDDDGWRVLVLTAEDIYRHPSNTLRRVQRLLIQRGQPDVPSVLLDEWQRYFAVRC